MKSKLPEVRIKYGWLLEQATIVMNAKWGDGTPIRSYQEYTNIADKYWKWWEPNQEFIMNGICGILGLEFHQNTIDVYVAPWFNPISDPMVIGPAFKTKDGFINTLTHEMIHRLITDNTTYSYDHDFRSDWKDMFGDKHSANTLIHIPVHAVMKKLYIEVINRPDLLELDIENTKQYKDYAKAWEYVDEIGYEQIIQKLLNKSKSIKY